VLSEIGYPAGTSIHPNLLVKTVETLRETLSGRNLAGDGFREFARSTFGG